MLLVNVTLALARSVDIRIMKWGIAKCKKMLLLDGDEDDIMVVIRVHWVMKRKRLMVLTRTEVDESIITDGRLDDSDQVGTTDLNELCVRA